MFAGEFDCPPDVAHALVGAAVRETFEETGLRLSRVHRQVGDKEEFVTGYEGHGARQKRWCKLSFEIEVMELDRSGLSHGGDLAGHGHVTTEKSTGSDGVDVGVVLGGTEGMNGVRVTLNLAEHQAYAWVSEEEIREDKYAIITAKAKDLMLEAFALKKADAANTKPLLAADTSEEPAKMASPA